MNDKTTIYMIGDSTMASYNEVTEYPRRGWGQQLCNYFNSFKVNVDNRALPGWTSQLFIDTGRFNEILKSAKQGDYIIMQFGHNDQKSTEKDYVSLNKYKENLKFFSLKAKEKGCTPIVCSSIIRRLYDNGRLIKTGSSDIYKNSLKDYADASKDVANELCIQFVDMFSYSVKEIGAMLPEKSKRLYMVLDPKDKYWLAKNSDFHNSDYYETGINPNDPYSFNPDNTHLSVEGADKWAGYFVDCIKNSTLTLSKYIL